MLRAVGCGLLAAMMLTACSPDPPEKERPPEPQAMRADEAPDDVTVSPIDRARAVEDQVEQADQRQREAIDEAGG